MQKPYGRFYFIFWNFAFSIYTDAPLFLMFPYNCEKGDTSVYIEKTENYTR